MLFPRRGTEPDIIISFSSGHSAISRTSSSNPARMCSGFFSKLRVTSRPSTVGVAKPTGATGPSLTLRLA
jgi:hypothetical protein